MKHLPTKDSENGVAFTLADFIEAGGGRLNLSVVAGGDRLGRRVDEPLVNRAGLALTGFYEHFDWRRLQLIGKAEMAYLRSLDDATRLVRLQALFDRKAFCVIFANGQQPGPDEIELAERAGAVFLTTPMKTRVFMRESTFVLERLGAPRASIYGTMVDVAGLGVLIVGDSGLGKSETALGLIKRGCALVSDDLTCIRKDVGNNVLYGSANESTAGYMEIRGIGIVHIPNVFGVNSICGEKQIDLVITLKRLAEVRGEIDRTGQTHRTRTILGVDVPNVILPVSEGRDLVNLVETAAQQQRLIQAGYDPVYELSEHLRRRADGMRTQENEKRKGKDNGRKDHA